MSTGRGEPVDELPEAADGPIPPIRVGVSACLLGEAVRYDGSHRLDPYLIHTLGQWVDWYPVCPEIEIGLGAPREVLRLEGATGAPRLVTISTRRDLTPRMHAWAAAKLEQLRSWNLCGYVFKARSPSCGLFGVEVYDAAGRPLPAGRGLFARALTEALPMLAVEEESRLRDPHLRENFIERLHASERWNRFLREDPTPGGLVAFHSAHKLVLLAHDPGSYRRLGQLVAGAGRTPWDGLLAHYATAFAAALSVLATRRKHANALYHLLGFFKRTLPAEDRRELAELIEAYRLQLVPLVVPLTRLRHHARMSGVPSWCRQQVYLEPSPRELALRDHA